MESNTRTVTFATESEQTAPKEIEQEPICSSPVSAEVILEVLHLPRKSLRQVSDVMTDEDIKKYKDFSELMIKTMYSANGVGLAAPQVGLNKKMIVIDPGWMNGTSERNPQVLYNPNILERFGTQGGTEGCLSVLGLAYQVERAEEVVVVWTDENGEHRKALYSGFPAKVIQHEIDHLNGKLIVDHMSRLRQDMYKRKLNKYLKKTAK